MGEKRARPPTWREVVTVLLVIEERLDQVVMLPRLPGQAKKDLQALLREQVRPLLRRAAR